MLRYAVRLLVVMVLLFSGGGPRQAGGAEGNPFPKRSGTDYLAPQLRTMQEDDDQNPAFLWVDQADTTWTRIEGKAGRSCESCHGAVENLRGVAARYPLWQEAMGRPVNLEQRINLCRTGNMEAEAWPYESDPLLGMTALVGLHSRGMPVDVLGDGPMRAWYEKGRDFYYARRGQLDCTCAHCHDENAGKKLRGDTLSQGHPNGFPTYRLGWQKLGSLHRRLLACGRDLRAETYALGSDEYLALEIFLAVRARGLPMETPAVRK